MNEAIIIAVGVILILLIVYLVLRLCGNFRKKVYKLFLKAEKEVKSGEKMDYVINNIYPYLPKIVKIFISQKAFRYILQKMFDVVADFLNDGKINKK